MARMLISTLCVVIGLACPAYAAGVPTGSRSSGAAKSATSPGLAACLPYLKHLPEQAARSGRDWGRVLTDIARRLPTSRRYQDAFQRYIRSGDLVTAGHEWTHFLNEYLASISGVNRSAFYLLDGRYMTLACPERMRGIVPNVPDSLRGDLYDLYLVRNGGNARVDPLYLFDEWTAYINDVTIAVDQLDQGKPLNPFSPSAIQTKTAGNVLEFMFYGFAVGMAVQKHDPGYYSSEEGKRLRDFITLNAERSLDAYARALRWEELSRGDTRHAELTRRFRSASDTSEMRAWVKRELGVDLDTALGRSVALAASSRGEGAGL